MASITLGQHVTGRHVQSAAGAPIPLDQSRRGCGPLGPWLIPPDELLKPHDLAMSCSVDGETVQDARYSDPFSDIPRLVADVTWVPPLLPGGANITGTPAGADIVGRPRSFLTKGQILESGIDGIRWIQNRCL